MHYSAKRGFAIACRLSVRLSVTLVDHDHTGWKSWKLIAWTISPTSSLFVPKGHIHLFPGEHGEILERKCSFNTYVRLNRVNREWHDLWWRCGCCLFTLVGASRGDLCDSTVQLSCPSKLLPECRSLRHYEIIMRQQTRDKIRITARTVQCV